MRRTSSVLALAIGLPLASPFPCPAQSAAPGFSNLSFFEDDHPARIFDTRGFALDPVDERLFLAIGSGIFRVDDGGQLQPVDDLGPGQFVALLMRAPGSRHLYYTSQDGGTVYRYDLDTDQITSLRGPRFGFDLAVTPGGDVLVSANPFFPANPDSRIWWIDPEGGPPQVVVEVSGPSGPILVDRSGNLLYGTQSTVFPPPPGATAVLGFDAADLAAAIAGGPPLTIADAAVVVSPLDGAYDMVMDDRDRLVVSDPNTGKVHRTRPGSFLLDGEPIAQAGGSALQLEFLGRDPAAPFAALQPASAGALFVLDNNFFDLIAVGAVEPRRPEVTSAPAGSTGPGPVDVIVRDGIFPGQAWLVASFLPPVGETPLASLNGVPLWVGLDLGGPIFSLPELLAPDDTATYHLVHPGGFEADVHFQALVVGPDSGLLVWGSSEVYTLRLLR